MQKDPCLVCPKMWKLQRTPEGHKFCDYCWFAYWYITAQSKMDDSLFDMMLFKPHKLKNRLQYWKGKAYRCPKCNNTTFYVDLEKHIPPKQGIFKPAPYARVSLICSRCGTKIRPEDCLK